MGDKFGTGPPGRRASGGGSLGRSRGLRRTGSSSRGSAPGVVGRWAGIRGLIDEKRYWEEPWPVAEEGGGRVERAAGVVVPPESVERQPAESAELGLGEPVQVVLGHGGLTPGVVGCQAGHGLSPGRELKASGGIDASAQPIFQT